MPFLTADPTAPKTNTVCDDAQQAKKALLDGLDTRTVTRVRLAFALSDLHQAYAIKRNYAAQPGDTLDVSDLVDARHAVDLMLIFACGTNEEHAAAQRVHVAGERLRDMLNVEFGVVRDLPEFTEADRPALVAALAPYLAEFTRFVGMFAPAT